MAGTDAKTPPGSDRGETRKPCEEGQTPEKDDCLPVEQHLHGLWQVLGLDDEDNEEHWEEREAAEEEESK